jgi:SOS-response transcriptional repressor LexA
VEHIGNLTRVVAAIHMLRGRNKLDVRQSMASYTDREGQPPYQDEIADHLGASSRGFVHRVLKSLETKGHVRIRTFERGGVELA